MLQYILALLTILAFVYFLFRNPVVDTYVVFVLIALPLINTKILPLAFGFFRTFDVITIIALIFLFKEFLMINGKIQFKCYIILALLFIGFTIISGFNLFLFDFYFFFLIMDLTIGEL